MREALLTGEINARSAFLARNLRTLALAQQEDAKQRRVGLVVDEDWQARWYLDRLPPHVHNPQALDAWFGKLSKDEKAALEWSRDELLMGEGADAVRFPAFIALGDARLAVRYRFEPGAPDDGMTVSGPLHLLTALDPVRLAWRAPGFVADKATALIKSLPKALRRNFVPAPDFARAFVEAVPPDERALGVALSAWLEKATGVTAEDVAKRLIDFGFHAPTLSFPVPGTLMVEPTESESLHELDRFIDAMIQIREEIRAIEDGRLDREDNPLKHAPHTAAQVSGSEWTHAYPRELAAFPLATLKQQKYWPPVARVDNVHGDKNVFCACIPVDAYKDEAAEA